MFEAVFQALAGLSRTAHLVQVFDSTVVKRLTAFVRRSLLASCAVSSGRSRAFVRAA